MPLAPIILFTYNRPWHTRQTLEAIGIDLPKKALEKMLFLLNSQRQVNIIAQIPYLL